MTYSSQLTGYPHAYAISAEISVEREAPTVSSLSAVTEVEELKSNDGDAQRAISLPDCPPRVLPHRTCVRNSEHIFFRTRVIC
jgi:hypothetical protein